MKIVDKNEYQILDTLTSEPYWSRFDALMDHAYEANENCCRIAEKLEKLLEATQGMNPDVKLYSDAFARSIEKTITGPVASIEIKDKTFYEIPPEYVILHQYAIRKKRVEEKTISDPLVQLGIETDLVFLERYLGERYMGLIASLLMKLKYEFKGEHAMKIVDMNEYQILDTITGEPYWSRFDALMEHAYTANDNCYRIAEKLEKLLDATQGMNPDVKLYSDAFAHSIEKTIIGPIASIEIKDKTFYEIPPEYVILHRYALRKKKVEEKSIKDPLVQLGIETDLAFLERYLGERYMPLIASFLMKLKYEFNHCDQKDLDEFDADELLVWAQYNRDNALLADQVNEALFDLELSSMFRAIKENILITLYFHEEKYDRVLTRAAKATSVENALPLVRQSYQMLGKIDEAFDTFEKYPSPIDRFTYALTGCLMIRNADLKKHAGTYKSVSDYIAPKMKAWAEKGYKDRVSEVPTGDINMYYRTIYGYLTEWLERNENYITLSEMGYRDLPDTLEELEDYLHVFDYCLNQERSFIDQLVPGQRVEKAAIREQYLYAYHQISQGHLHATVYELLAMFYRLGIEDAVQDVVLDYLATMHSGNRPLDEGALCNLLQTAYIRAVEDGNVELQNRLHSFFELYGIREADLEEDGTRARILKSLSDIGKYEYRAACTYYDYLAAVHTSFDDTGMLSVSYYRIIENESNERLYRKAVLAMDFDALSEALAAHARTLSSAKPADGDLSPREEYKRKWKQNLDTLKKMKAYALHEPGAQNKPLMLGGMEVLAEAVDISHTDPVAVMVREALYTCMTEKGIQEFESGILKEWYDSNRRNTFRNPPAHNRYLHFEVAKRAKEYVEEQLLLMKEMFQ